MIDAIKAVGVLGLGVMGFDIAFLYAQRGYRTLVFDASETEMNRVAIRRDQTIARLKKRNRISDAEAERVSHGLMPAADLPALTSSDLVTEAVSESGKTKKSVYKTLRDSGFTGILTTNTSSLTRASLLDSGEYPNERFATTHFFNPVLYVTRVMHEFRGEDYLRSSELLASMAKSNPLFYIDQKPNPAIYDVIANRGTGVDTAIVKLALSRSVRVAAARAVELGEAPVTVDFISTEGLKFPRGPLAEIDDLGPDTVLKDLNRLSDAIPKITMRAPEILRSMAKEHQTFFKAGQANPAIAAVLQGSAHARH